MPSPLSAPLSLATPRRNLARLTLVRGISWTGFLACIIIGIEIFQFHLAAAGVFVVVILMGLINIVSWWRLQKAWPVTESEYFFHLLFDVTGLTLLFYFTGGATNPFISYYLVPLTISAATLPWIYSWIIATATLSAYTFLMQFYHPIPQLVHDQNLGVVNLHILGMWINFLMSAGLITFFVFKMANALRARDAHLAHIREQGLRDEQILAIATQAAGTAHELGTPLSTMAIVLGEMCEAYQDDEELMQELHLLQQQVKTCKTTLQGLVKAADRDQLASRQVQMLDVWWQQVMTHWQVLRPDVVAQIEWASTGPMPQIAPEVTWQQAMLNLLNNAADASPQAVHIRFTWDTTQTYINIRDQGTGIAEEIIEQLGDSLISTKQEGMGLGLLLTHATLNRAGGEVRLYNHPEGGTLTQVVLPLAS
ncbi:two-component system, sensor histidine kinase RegB [Allopseudospirillum japonicum]|uniref:histidine kinase n=1 Tax=Allopseudospirillum japonicum TaxID=64971 RepID=A0A1H6RUK6_9GAMM|nr:ATP-binding protein [Allopseudospirillum japonicum]SEI55470.1 two-component system, sensor histidine kinase RegB [Allopseudospirillum japonicum]